MWWVRKKNKQPLKAAFVFGTHQRRTRLRQQAVEYVKYKEQKKGSIMQYQSFLIKYAEIGTKGKNRYMFEDALIRQIRYALSSVDGEFDVTKESGRILCKRL